MSNGYYNGQTRTSLKGGKGAMPHKQGSGGPPAFKEKPGFSTGAPGKKHGKDRSGGAKRIKIYADSDGL